jgi:hypothetical protein
MQFTKAFLILSSIGFVVSNPIPEESSHEVLRRSVLVSYCNQLQTIGFYTAVEINTLIAPYAGSGTAIVGCQRSSSSFTDH